MIDCALWEIIEYGNSAPKTKIVEGVKTVIPPRSVQEKAQRRLEIKARNTLMMGISNEHQLKFNSIKDAKSLLQAVEKRFGCNAAIKKTTIEIFKSSTFVVNLLTGGSTNEAVNATHSVSAASTQANIVNSKNVDNLSDVVIYAFLASQPSSPQLVNDDLE
ncbi:hypothetical protein Tco_0397389 [Tanacetum coccineum]